jgi:hypothetical protein
LWEEYQKDIYEYDNSNRISQWINQQYYEKDWYNAIKENYDYAPSGKLYIMTNQRWKLDKWVNDSKVIYTYDNSNDSLEILLLSWNGNEWENKERRIREDYLSSYDSFIRNNDDNFLVYPNPSAGLFYVFNHNIMSQNHEFELFSYSGELVKRFDALDNTYQGKIIDSEGLPDGMYILKIISGDKIKMVKLFKHK